MEQIEQTLGSFLKAPESIHGDETYQIRGLTSQDFNPTEIIGMEEDVKKIKGWIFDTNEALQQVAIVGMGDWGKPRSPRKYFTILKCDNEETLMRYMLERSGKHVSGIGSACQLLGEVQHVLADNACLIVMDDVWQVDVVWWTNLGASDMGVESSRIHKPEPLNDEHSWTLFSKFAFSSRKGICSDPNLEELGKGITKKCGGLPLAIKTIGALLAAKNDHPHEWMDISRIFILN
ncbi:hypothetical protein F8388_027357 [Cannabis sativa]|uniref:NB-ARC domain-containing protein n=1 Tax=Cannabis sativa TaxID=3483 RepID=A0A7J6DNV2_CANSA|nr:hypothetical protein F8388_027357 [Cannabis sativa]